VNPLAITGYAVVSPIGVGRSQWLRALGDPQAASARAFAGAPTVLKPETVPDALAGEVWGFDATEYLGAKGLRNFDRLTRFLIVAGKLALEDAGLKKDGAFVALGPERVGVCSATAYGSLDSITEMMLVSELEDPRYVNPARFPNTVINSAAAYVSIWEDLRAPNTTIVDGNCGALDAVLTCENHLGNGRADAFLVGGGEVLSEPLYIAFRKLDLLAEGERRYAPGSPQSGGMRLAEGAAYLCMESLQGARQRNARVRGMVVGCGNTFEPPASEAVLAHASSRSIERAVRLALREAAMQPGEIDLVCLSANGIEQFDSAELEAVREIVSPQAAIAAPKAMYGETLGASGALGMAAVLGWFEGVEPAPLLQGDAAIPASNVLVLAVGFYGNVSAVVMTRAEKVGKAGEA
jgi:3-oxoacyl-[acyl-carrier-protein] synthase II